MTKEPFLDFSGAHSTTVDLIGWSARAANILRLLFGNKLTLAVCKRLPLSAPNPHGLLVWSPAQAYTSGEWALLWNTGYWYAFIVAKANSDAQLRMFREGGLTYPTGGISCAERTGEVK